MTFNVAALTLASLNTVTTLKAAYELCGATNKAEKAEVKAQFEQLMKDKVAADEAAAAAQEQADLEAAAAAAAAVQEQAAPETNKGRRATTTLVKVATSPSMVDGVAVQRRNTNCPVRAVAVFYSTELNLAWLGTHLGFGTKTADAAMKIMATDTATGCLLPLQNAYKANPASVQMELFAKDIPVGAELDAAKLEAYKAFAAKGFVMLGRNLAAKADADAAKAAKAAQKAAADAAKQAQPAPEAAAAPAQEDLEALAAAALEAEAVPA